MVWRETNVTLDRKPDLNLMLYKVLNRWRFIQSVQELLSDQVKPDFGGKLLISLSEKRQHRNIIMIYQSEPITMWIDRRLVLRKSVIQGVGTFAIEPIPAGQLLILTTGGLVLTAQDRQSGELQLEAEMYNEESLPDGLSIVTPKVFHYYVNHCCEPNAVDLSRSPNITQYIAWRDIAAQEEISTDYGILGARIERCMCKSPRCRGQVTPEDWRIPELQQRYRGYFPWHIEQEIEQANKH